MAASKAKGFSYGEPFKVSIGGRFFTQTVLSIVGEEEEYPKGGIPIEASKLGLPDGLADVMWANLIISEKEAYKSYDCQIIGGKLVIWSAGKEKEFSAEVAEGSGALKGYTVTVWAIGR